MGGFILKYCLSEEPFRTIEGNLLQSSSVAFEQSILTFKRLLARKLMAGFALFCTIGLPISLSRWFDVGFQIVFVHHIVITLITYICYFRPDKSNYKVDLVCIVTLLSSMIISGTMSFGLQTGAMTFTVFCTFLVGIAWGLRSAVVYAVCWCVFILVCGYLFSVNALQHSVDPNRYSESFGAWATVAIGSGVTIIFMLIVAKMGYSYLSLLIEEIEKQKQEIEYLANTDSLTGFSANRLAIPLLSQTLKAAKRDGTKAAVCFIDLNDFKHINDSLGHQAGDEVLIVTAQRIKSALREIDITCRVGGDEFLIILPKLHVKTQIVDILKRIVSAWAKPVILGENVIMLTGSIGVAVYPDDAKKADDLRRQADNAMYVAKKQGVPYHFHGQQIP